MTNLVRIMRNVSPRCCVEERKNHVQYFIHRMQFSGYSQETRTEVYRDANRRYERIVSASADGTCPMYRSKFWKQEERRKEKARKRDPWYGENFDTVMFIENTKNSRLARECQSVIDKTGLKIKVVERNGTSLKDLLTRSYPYERESVNNVEYVTRPTKSTAEQETWSTECGAGHAVKVPHISVKHVGH